MIIQEPKFFIKPKNNIFKDLKHILYQKYIQQLNKKYEDINIEKRKVIFNEIELLLNQYKISISTIANYYNVMKQYMEGDNPRYSELLTGETIIE